PKAGFPSYTFEVSNNGGLSLAVPVQGVPIALSVTGAAEATGSITIKDAVTYGLDTTSMYQLLLDAEKAGKLRYAIPPEGEEPWYLRMITRVFAAQSFNVVLTATSTLGGGVDAGARQPVADAGGQLENGLTVSQINQQLEAVGLAADAAGNVLPGGSVRATFASGRTVGFEETFDEPIVVGYHGFDAAIDSKGRIGPLIPTFQVLDDEAVPLDPVPTAIRSEDSAYMAMVEMLRTLPNESATKVVRAAAANDRDVAKAVKERLAGRPGEPVVAWQRATDSMARSKSAKNMRSDWLSRAIRQELEE
ncbi:MAG: hypothetical protein ACR2NU_15725, partial [Aeoliella sp.]